MSKQNSVSHNKLKQKLRKWLQGEGEDQMTYEKQLERYKANPIEEASEASNSDDEEDEANDDEDEEAEEKVDAAEEEEDDEED